MSLINDALKRAKQAQQHAQTPGPSSLQFRPVEPNQRPKRRWDWVMPAIVAIIGVTFLIWMRPWSAKDSSGAALETKARTLAAAKESSPAAAPSQVPPPEPARPTQEKIAPAPKEATAAIAGTQTTNAEPVVKTAPAPEPAAPPAPALKLQAIVYSPTRPSAIVNGRTVFLGDRVGDLRVTAITQETATLIGAGKTNVLTLIP